MPPVRPLGAVADFFCPSARDAIFRCEAFENGGGGEVGEADAE